MPIFAGYLWLDGSPAGLLPEIKTLLDGSFTGTRNADNWVLKWRILMHGPLGHDSVG